MASNESARGLAPEQESCTASEETTPTLEYVPGTTSRAIIEWLEDNVDQPTYLKSRDIAADLPLSIQQIGAALGTMAATEKPETFEIEKWTSSSARSTWYVCPVATDGGQLVERRPQDLTLFEQELLYALADIGKPVKGLAIKDALEEYYDEEINPGRLYPNLDQLAEKGLIDKGKRDRRTNEYALTDEARHLLHSDAQRRFWIMNSSGGDA